MAPRGESVESQKQRIWKGLEAFRYSNRVEAYLDARHSVAGSATGYSGGDTLVSRPLSAEKKEAKSSGDERYEMAKQILLMFVRRLLVGTDFFYQNRSDVRGPSHGLLMTCTSDYENIASQK